MSETVQHNKLKYTVHDQYGTGYAVGRRAVQVIVTYEGVRIALSDLGYVSGGRGHGRQTRMGMKTRAHTPD